MGKQKLADKNGPSLEREFGVKGGIAIVACTQIGSGIFMSPGRLVSKVNSIGFWVVYRYFFIKSLILL